MHRDVKCEITHRPEVMNEAKGESQAEIEQRFESMEQMHQLQETSLPERLDNSRKQAGKNCDHLSGDRALRHPTSAAQLRRQSGIPEGVARLCQIPPPAGQHAEAVFRRQAQAGEQREPAAGDEVAEPHEEGRDGGHIEPGILPHGNLLRRGAARHAAARTHLPPALPQITRRARTRHRLPLQEPLPAAAGSDAPVVPRELWHESGPRAQLSDQLRHQAARVRRQEDPLHEHAQEGHQHAHQHHVQARQETRDRVEHHAQREARVPRRCRRRVLGFHSPLSHVSRSGRRRLGHVPSGHRSESAPGSAR